MQSRVLQTYVVNFICQKLQQFWAYSDYMGKINKVVIILKAMAFLNLSTKNSNRGRELC